MKQHFKIIPAVYVVLRKGDKVLLSRRFNTGYADGQYSMIAGHLNGNEKLREAMAREAQEEAGINIDPSDLTLVHTMHLKSEIPGSSDDERIAFYFEPSHYTGKPRIMEPDKCDDMRWFKFDSLPETIINHVKQALDKIYQNIDYSEFGW